MILHVCRDQSDLSKPFTYGGQCVAVPLNKYPKGRCVANQGARGFTLLLQDRHAPARSRTITNQSRRKSDWYVHMPDGSSWWYWCVDEVLQTNGPTEQRNWRMCWSHCHSYSYYLLHSRLLWYMATCEVMRSSGTQALKEWIGKKSAMPNCALAAAPVLSQFTIPALWLSPALTNSGLKVAIAAPVFEQ
jgi:hypothetical protein